MSDLRDQLRKVAEGKLSPEDLRYLKDWEIEKPEEAAMVCEAMEQALQRRFNEDVAKLARTVAELMQQVQTREAVEVFGQHAIPLLHQVFRRMRGGVPIYAHDLLFLLKIFALYRDAEGLASIPELIRHPALAENYLWSVLFDVLSDKEAQNPLAIDVAERLRSPLPDHFAGVAYLDMVNALCDQGRLNEHPFDTPEGKARLKQFLAAEDENSSFAVSAAAALAFVSNPERDILFLRARAHPEINVRIQTAWADAHLGHEEGLNRLVEWSTNPSYASKAIAYLEDLGLEERIPAKAQDPDFRAMAELSDWLSHPNEFGEPPMRIEQLDTCELFWPPASQRVRVWAFRYAYPGKNGKTETIDYGLVGSCTFSLFEAYGENPTPEDIYALHLSWETDGEPNLERGRQLLNAVLNP